MSDPLSHESEKHMPAEDNLEISEPENRLPQASLASLSEPLRAACSRAGWTTLTPVQSLCIPYLLAGRDLMTQSRTGSGKTGCYLLPMIASLNPALRRPQALVLVPTRELARQVERESAVLFGQDGLRACAIYGGVGYKKQIADLRGGIDVVIATPGRAMDLIIRHELDFRDLRILVFDEADRMLSIGFYPDIKEIAGHLPAKRQTALFSATYPPHVFRMAEEFMHDPEMLSLSRNEVHVAEVEHMFCQVKPMDKDRTLVRLLETENPASALVFCNTKADTHYVAGVLKGFGYNADELSADLPQKKREAVLARIRSGELRYLAATDVAARGIDIPSLSHVFLYDPPEDPESYIHRAGRTGRAGAAGVVISLVDVMEKLELERIARNYKIQLRELPNPTDEEVAQAACERLRVFLESRLRSLTGLERIRADRYLPLSRELQAPGEEDNLRLLAMILDDSHRLSLGETRFPIEPTKTKQASSGANSRRRGRSSRRGTPRKASRE